MNSFISVPEKLIRSVGVKNPRPYVYGAYALAAGILIFIVIRTVKNRRMGKWNSGITVDRLNAELGKLNTNGTTITKGDAIIIAQNLLNAMDRWGTDEDAIIDNLSRCKTRGDLILVIQTFGIKPKDAFGLADTFISRNVEGVMKNLNGWLRDELSGADLREVKRIYDNLGVAF